MDFSPKQTYEKTLGHVDFSHHFLLAAFDPLFLAVLGPVDKLVESPALGKTEIVQHSYLCLIP